MTSNAEQKKMIFKMFIKEYFELLEFIKKNSENSFTFTKFYTKNYVLKKTNIKLFIKGWHENITHLYYDKIMDGDIVFFLNKNYDYDISENKIMSSEFNMGYYIDYFKKIYDSIEKELVDIFVTKIQRLTQLSYLYYKL